MSSVHAPVTAALRGLIAAPHTPFRRDGELALEVVPLQASLLAANGVRGAFVCGTTGEGCSLTPQERMRLIDAWVPLRSPRMALIVQVGDLSLKVSRELARHAQEAGADAVAAVAPSYFKPATAVELADWCQRVAAAAPRLPFYYYHIPDFTGVRIPVADFLRAAHGRRRG